MLILIDTETNAAYEVGEQELRRDLARRHFLTRTGHAAYMTEVLKDLNGSDVRHPLTPLPDGNEHSTRYKLGGDIWEQTPEDLRPRLSRVGEPRNRQYIVTALGEAIANEWDHHYLVSILFDPPAPKTDRQLLEEIVASKSRFDWATASTEQWRLFFKSIEEAEKHLEKK